MEKNIFVSMDENAIYFHSNLAHFVHSKGSGTIPTRGFQNDFHHFTAQIPVFSNKSDFCHSF